MRQQRRGRGQRFRRGIALPLRRGDLRAHQLQQQQLLVRRRIAREQHAGDVLRQRRRVHDLAAQQVQTRLVQLEHRTLGMAGSVFRQIDRARRVQVTLRRGSIAQRSFNRSASSILRRRVKGLLAAATMTSVS